MTQFNGTLSERVALVDAVDHLLNRGVVLSGQATLSLAGVDLVYLGINLLLTSAQTLDEHRGEGPGFGARPVEPGRSAEDRPTTNPAALRSGEGAVYGDARSGEPGIAGGTPPRTGVSEQPVDAPADRPEQGLARLVLTLVELLRQIVERQAVRRMEGETLPEEAVERMGLALMELEAKMIELRELFGLSADELNLDLGPLGRLLDDGR